MWLITVTNEMYRGEPTDEPFLLAGFSWFFLFLVFFSAYIFSGLVTITFSLAQSRTTHTKMTDDDGLCKKTKQKAETEASRSSGAWFHSPKAALKTAFGSVKKNILCKLK